MGAGVSLIAAAACSLLLVSALVAFHGWPGVAPSGTVISLAVSSPVSPRRHLEGPSGALVLGTVAADTAAARRAGVPDGDSSRPGGSPRLGLIPVSATRSSGAVSSPAASVGVSPSSLRFPAASGGSSSPSAGVVSPGAGSPSVPPMPVPVPVSAIGDKTGNVISQVGHTVAGVGHSVGQVGSKVAPAVGQVIQQTGVGAGTTVSGVGDVVGGVTGQSSR